MTEYWKRKRQGYAPMTATMLHILDALQRAKADGWPYIYLTGVHKATLKALKRYELIFASHGLDGVRYTITDLGEKHLRVYSSHPRRDDGLCPACGQRPKHVYASGRCDGYCLECAHSYRKRLRELRRPTVKPGRLCSQCRQRPVKVFSSGRAKTWCADCLKKKRAEYRARKHQRKLARIQAGEFIPCARCGQNPVYHTATCVYDLCRDCWKEYMDSYNVRRRYTAVLGKYGLKQERS